MMPRVILHIDLDAFFCAVEELHDPSLRGKPFAVGGRPDARGVVASCSYPARKCGIRSAMPMAQALRLCPGLVIVSGHHHRYSEVSQQVMDRLHQHTPLVEQVSIDEAFLDVSGITETGEILARRIQAQIRDELGLPASVGVASNKLVAKIATEVGKKAAHGAGPPFAITVIPPGEEAAFLAPLPADMLWGVGPKTAVRLAGLGIYTIGDIARWSEEDLVRRFGETGRELSRHARGMDDSPIVTEHEVKSISQEVTFAHDISDDAILKNTLRDLSAQVGERLRRSNLAGVTVRIKVRWPDFTTLTRQATLLQPTDNDEEIASTVQMLLAKVRPAHKAVRLIGVGVSGLGPPVRQLSLWDDDADKVRRLQSVLEELRRRYGEKIIRRGDQRQRDR
jgi:DNA polymerase-4